MKPHTRDLISISYTFKYTGKNVAKSVDSFLLHNTFLKKVKVISVRVIKAYGEIKV